MGKETETFVTQFDRMRQENPNKEAYISYDVNLKRTSMTFQELWTLSCRYAHLLKQQGIERGDYVVVTTPLSLEYKVASFGVLLAGASHISMEKIFSECQMIMETLKLSQGKYMIIADDSNCEIWDHFKTGASDISRDRYSATYSGSASSLRKLFFTPRSAGAWKMGFLDYLRQCTDEFVDTGLTPKDGAISVSSLNAGIAVPKLVEHTHGSFVDMARKWTRSLNFEKGHFIYPFYLIAMLPFDLLTGRTRVISDFLEQPVKYMAEHIIEVKRAERISSTLIAPVEITRMVDILKVSFDPELPFLREIASGGMPMVRAFMDKARVLGETILICYVASETCLVSMNRLKPEEKFIPFDCGMPVSGVEVKVVDEKFQEVEAGQSGQILVRSGSLLLRYVGDPERTEAAFLDDGWYKTGDEGCIGPDGQLLVYGRQTEAISRGIVLTYPAWLEKPIASHPEVLEVTVVPVPDDVNFNNTCACVVKSAESRLTEEDILEMVRKSLSTEGNEYLALDYAVFFEESLPKLSREKLGEIAAERLGLTKS